MQIVVVVKTFPDIVVDSNKNSIVGSYAVYYSLERVVRAETEGDYLQVTPWELLAHRTFKFPERELTALALFREIRGVE